MGTAGIEGGQELTPAPLESTMPPPPLRIVEIIEVDAARVWLSEVFLVVQVIVRDLNMVFLSSNEPVKTVTIHGSSLQVTSYSMNSH